MEANEIAPSPKAPNENLAKEQQEPKAEISFYNLCLVSINIKGADPKLPFQGTMKVIEVLRREVKISEEQANADNKVVAQRDKGLSKYWIPSSLNSKEDDKIDVKEVSDAEEGKPLSNFYLQLV